MRITKEASLALESPFSSPFPKNPYFCFQESLHNPWACCHHDWSGYYWGQSKRGSSHKCQQLWFHPH